MKEFEFFLKKGDVKKQSPDKNLAKSTFNECLERLEFSKSLLEKTKSKYVLENAYEAMREAADSLLYVQGFKSFSHEASIAYLTGKGFNEQEILEFDRFRRIRNGIKYYGGDCDEADAKSSIELAENIIGKIKSLVGEDIIHNKTLKFKILENIAIADIAFEAYGKDYDELFENAAFAVFQMAANLDTVEEKEKRKVELEADTAENLLYDFLSEILFLKDSEQLLFKSSKANVRKLEGKFLVKATFFGEKIDRGRHELDNDIKAITMHMFKIERIKGGYKAVVVVDI